VTEEIWSLIRNESEQQFLLHEQEPAFKTDDTSVLQQFELVRELVTAIRNFRSEKGISPKESIQLYCRSRLNNDSLAFSHCLIKLGNLSSLEYSSEDHGNGFTLMIRTDEFFIPAGDSIDLEAEKEKLEKELEYLKGFLASVNKKLSNEKFVANAKPEIVETEKRKESDALQKIKLLENQLQTFAQ
jgi:valyl-tRNA synthetase